VSTKNTNNSFYIVWDKNENKEQLIIVIGNKVTVITGKLL